MDKTHLFAFSSKEDIHGESQMSSKKHSPIAVRFKFHQSTEPTSLTTQVGKEAEFHLNMEVKTANECKMQRRGLSIHLYNLKV